MRDPPFLRMRNLRCDSAPPCFSFRSPRCRSCPRPSRPAGFHPPEPRSGWESPPGLSRSCSPRRRPCGHGGVVVLQAPYLVFYPDKNRDDVPDSAPEVLLTGFGMEDAQSLANHLTWGPDGWLYGLNGSTTTCVIRGTEFQQGVWRYHPVSREFELFCEGGGNVFGLTFDRVGRLLYSAN